ncbi:MAG: hypothetical protein AYK18_09095 [Theionarchaea archaeon DG-70]|nr:MAG: hypothetical protein AYK18_09095 [Theionarchaea archaeon DG-70]
MKAETLFSFRVIHPCSNLCSFSESKLLILCGYLNLSLPDFNKSATAPGFSLRRKYLWVLQEYTIERAIECVYMNGQLYFC